MWISGFSLIPSLFLSSFLFHYRTLLIPLFSRRAKTKFLKLIFPPFIDNLYVSQIQVATITRNNDTTLFARHWYSSSIIGCKDEKKKIFSHHHAKGVKRRRKTMLGVSTIPSVQRCRWLSCSFARRRSNTHAPLLVYCNAHESSARSNARYDESTVSALVNRSRMPGLKMKSAL